MNKTKDTPVYISHVELGGYKSIYNMEIDLLPGLNIIIGPNGSGKTNFVDFIDKILGNKPENISDSFSFQAVMMAGGSQLVTQIKSVKKRNGSFLKQPENVTRTNYRRENGKNIPLNKHDIENIENEYPDLIYGQKIGFAIPQQLNGLDISLRFKLDYKLSRHLSYSADDYISFPSFSYNIQQNIKEGLQKEFSVLKRNELEEIKEWLGKFELYDVAIRNLERFTLIKGIRLFEVFRIYEEDKLGYGFDISFEFLVYGKWITWQQLSDGTKRLFYIITEVVYGSNFQILEEPEIGIHPDQLFDLMTFLKEQSQRKQILVTTHSPMVLDILDTDELDRIILTKYDKVKGTTMKRLSKKQIVKAQGYMDTEGLWLRDYWIHSDLEGEIAR